MSEPVDKFTKNAIPDDGVVLDLRPVDQLYGWLLLISAILSLTGAGFIFLVIFLFTAYGSGGKEGIESASNLRTALQDKYNVRLGEYPRWALVLLTVGWSKQVSLGSVKVQGASQRWENVYARVHEGRVFLSRKVEGDSTGFEDLHTA